jgi:hypothetical protein
MVGPQGVNQDKDYIGARIVRSQDIVYLVARRQRDEEDQGDQEFRRGLAANGCDARHMDLNLLREYKVPQGPAKANSTVYVGCAAGPDST